MNQNTDKFGRFKKGMAAWNKGLKCSEEWIKKSSEAHKGRIAWNKGKHKIKPLFDKYYCTVCGKQLTDRQVANLLCRKKLNGKHPKYWACSKECAMPFIINGLINRPVSEETRKKIGDTERGTHRAYKARPNSNGRISWNKGTAGKGVMKPNKTSFKKGQFAKEKHRCWKGGISELPECMRTIKFNKRLYRLSTCPEELKPIINAAIIVRNEKKIYKEAQNARIQS